MHNLFSPEIILGFQNSVLNFNTQVYFEISEFTILFIHIFILLLLIIYIFRFWALH
jgi:hypothetical protein